MNATEETNPFEQLKQLGKDRLKELTILAGDLFSQMSPKDLFTLLFPPALGAEMMRGVIHKKAFHEDNGVAPTDEPLVQSVLAMAHWWSQHYFKTKIFDVENVPADRPVLLVGNHSAGLMPLDALFAIHRIRDHNGTDKSVYSLVHDYAYMAPRIAKVAKRMGVIRAKRENAIDALQNGHHVLVYPGGDRDAFRKFTDRKKVILAERKGFIRLALQTGVPIVPMVSVGLHESFIVLSDGKSVARKLGLKDYLRTDIMPLSLSFPWGLVPAFMPFIPLPTNIEMQFGSPMEYQGSPDDDVLVDHIYNEVQTTMQKMMDALYEEHETLLGLLD